MVNFVLWDLDCIFASPALVLLLLMIVSLYVCFVFPQLFIKTRFDNPEQVWSLEKSSPLIPLGLPQNMLASALWDCWQGRLDRVFGIPALVFLFLMTVTLYVSSGVLGYITYWPPSIWSVGTENSTVFQTLYHFGMATTALLLFIAKASFFFKFWHTRANMFLFLLSPVVSLAGSVVLFASAVENKQNAAAGTLLLLAGALGSILASGFQEADIRGITCVNSCCCCCCFRKKYRLAGAVRKLAFPQHEMRFVLVLVTLALAVAMVVGGIANNDNTIGGATLLFIGVYIVYWFSLFQLPYLTEYQIIPGEDDSELHEVDSLSHHHILGDRVSEMSKSPKQPANQEGGETLSLKSSKEKTEEMEGFASSEV